VCESGSPYELSTHLIPTGSSDTFFVKFQIFITKEYLELEPIGVLFIICFGTILIIQFVAMLFHRFGTLSHMLATTQIPWMKRAAKVGTVNSITQ
jgi:chitin synthase